MISYPYMGVTIVELWLNSLCELCVYIKSDVPCVYMHYVYTLNTHHVHQLGLYTVMCMKRDANVGWFKKYFQRQKANSHQSNNIMT